MTDNRDREAALFVTLGVMSVIGLAVIAILEATGAIH